MFFRFLHMIMQKLDFFRFSHSLKFIRLTSYINTIPKSFFLYSYSFYPNPLNFESKICICFLFVILLNSFLSFHVHFLICFVLFTINFVVIIILFWIHIYMYIYFFTFFSLNGKNKMSVVSLILRVISLFCIINFAFIKVFYTSFFFHMLMICLANYIRCSSFVLRSFVFVYAIINLLYFFFF